MKQAYILPIVVLTVMAVFPNVGSGQVEDRNVTNRTYLFYLHGRIIEEAGPTPTHPDWGLYDYPAIVNALGSRGAEVVSEVRESGTDINEYARKTFEDIEQLIAGGVSPAQIVVAGFSKGGGITIQVSRLLGRPGIRYVLLASCSSGISSYPDLYLTGHIFSVFETSDEIGMSCRDLAERGTEVSSFQELEITTGKEHGAFYLPYPVWVKPVLDWVHGDDV